MIFDKVFSISVALLYSNGHYILEKMMWTLNFQVEGFQGFQA